MTRTNKSEGCEEQNAEGDPPVPPEPLSTGHQPTHPEMLTLPQQQKQLSLKACAVPVIILLIIYTLKELKILTSIQFCILLHFR